MERLNDRTVFVIYLQSPKSTCHPHSIHEDRDVLGHHVVVLSIGGILKSITSLIKQKRRFYFFDYECPFR